MRSLSGGLPSLEFIAVLPPGAAPDVQSTGAAQDMLQGRVNAPVGAASSGGSREKNKAQQGRAADAAAAAAASAADRPGPHAPAAADAEDARGNHGESCAHALPARYNKSLLRGVLQLMGCKQRHAHKASASLLSLHRLERDARGSPISTAGRHLVDVTVAGAHRRHSLAPPLPQKPTEHNRFGVRR